MNRRLFIAMCVIAVAVACRKDNSEVAPASPTSAPQSNNSSTSRYAYRTTDDSTVNSLFISKSVANEMISSYIYSLGNTSSSNIVNDLKAFSIDADSLRMYLADTRIKNVKLIFGHTMKYINAGNTGKYAGMQSGAITIIVAGYDSNGVYIYHAAGNEVLDHAAPCPYTCGIGDAGSDLLQ